MTTETDREAWDVLGDWLLRSGAIDDLGVWSDASVWIDTPEVWTEVATGLELDG